MPRTGDVHWKASTGVAGDRAATGEVRVKFPPPIGKVGVGEWGKNGKKVGRPGNSGTYHYSLPTLIAGIKVPVSGEHHEPGINCFGAVVVSVRGPQPARVGLGRVDVRHRDEHVARHACEEEGPVMKAHGRPVLGAINGFFLGLFVALDLLFFGVVRLDSVVITILPIAGIVVGIVLGFWGPLGRSRVGLRAPDSRRRRQVCD